MSIKYFLIALVLFALQTKAQLPTPKILDSNWVLNTAISDNFNASKIDTAKWWDFNPAWYGRKPAFFDRKNVTQKKGILTIKAKALKKNKVTVEQEARGQNLYSTGIVKSKQRVLYGYFEAKCKVMKANVCNAFWLYDPLDADKKYIHGDFSEEIDIFEVFGKTPKKEFENTYWATLHRYETPYVESIVNKKKTKLENYAKHTQMPYAFYNDYHVFGLLWTAEKLIWYLDGEKMFERTNDFFHRPLHIVFDAEIMDTWMGLPNNADLPAKFEIDYFILWQKNKVL